MAASGSLTLTGTISGLQWGNKVIGGTAGLTVASAGSEVNAAAVTTIVLANGANTITVPSTACTGCVIVFGPASAVTKTIKGITGDTGLAVTKNGWCAFSFDAAGAPASFVITAGGADTGNVTEICFF